MKELVIEKKKRAGKPVMAYINDELFEKFEVKIKKIGSDKTKVIRALIESWVEGD